MQVVGPREGMCRKGLCLLPHQVQEISGYELGVIIEVSAQLYTILKSNVGFHSTKFRRNIAKSSAAAILN